MKTPYLFYKLAYACLILTSVFSGTFARDRAHFYSTFPLWDEPRVEKDWLFSLDLAFYNGRASDSKNPCRCKTKLLDIYGQHNMQLLGENVPDKSLNRYTDMTLTLLSLIPACNSNFAKLSFCGEFRGTTVDIAVTQNFKRGFFACFHIPIRTLAMNCIRYEDLSPLCPNQPNRQNPIWQSFLTQFPTILKQYELCIGSWKRTHVGDTSILLGWTRNYQETEHIDFVDYSFTVGGLFPSGAKRDPDITFSLPHGYDGHFGIPFSFDLAVGLYEWLTFGMHLDAIALLKASKELRMKTAHGQCGFIKLAKGKACVNPGFVINAGGMVKADHFTKGLSLAVGYTFSYKGNDTIYPCDTTRFDTFIASDDEMFKEWRMHTVHFKADYDFTKENWRFGPRIGFFYNWHVSGLRTFKTNSFGGEFGLDIDIAF